MVHRFVSEIVFGNLINLKNYENKYVANVLSEFSNIYCIVPPFLTQKCSRPSFANSEKYIFINININ